MLSGGIPDEQKKAYWLLEALSGVSLVMIIGVVWFMAQQSAQIDDSASDVKSIAVSIEKLADSTREVQRDVDRLGTQMTSMSRDIDRNRDAVTALDRRMLRESFQRFREDEPEQRSPP